MRTVSCLCLFLALAPGSPPGAAQTLGEAPASGAAAPDDAATARWPALRDERTSPPAMQLRQLQIGMRAHRLGFSARSPLQAWTRADTTLRQAQARLAQRPRESVHRFSGTRASQLNRLLRKPGITAIQVDSARLEVDEPVLVRGGPRLLDLGRTELHAGAAAPRFLLRVEAGESVTVTGGRFVAGQWGVLVHGGRQVVLRGGYFEGLSAGGVAMGDTRSAVLAEARFERIRGTPVLLHEGSADSVVLDNQIQGNLGGSNWHAGIVLSDRQANVIANPSGFLEPDGHWARPQRIDARLAPPRGNVIAYNRIVANASSGMYADGAAETVMVGNVIEGNSKEGLCLDNGATANVVALNLLRLNGQRWGKTDEELRLDFVLQAGRLPDGTAAAKTPAVSVDNALYNIIYGNQIDRNYGGGIKMVRTAFFNLVGLNVLTDNNEGASAAFHYFGVELGAAPADPPPAPDLDFTPSRGNIVFGNTIRGSHHTGIFFGAGSTDNASVENSIFGAQHWALEQPRAQSNVTLNNLSNLPSRNIDTGLNPALQRLSRGQYDPPP